MKYLFFSDLHYRETRIKDCELVLDKVMEIGKKEKVDAIVNGGDTFQDKGLIRIKCHDSYLKKRKEWDGRWIDIVGNHDQDDRDGSVHAMKSFGLLPKSSVVDVPFFDRKNKILMLPYMHDIKDYLKITKNDDVIKEGEWTLIAHMGVKGSFMSESKRDETGVPLEVCRYFKQVFLGHYHKPHSLENVTYVGSPLQQNFSEMGQDKGVIIFDTKDPTNFKRVEIKGTPKHHEAKLFWVDGKPKTEIPKVNKQDYVRFDIILVEWCMIDCVRLARIK